MHAVLSVEPELDDLMSLIDLQVDREKESLAIILRKPRVICVERGETWMKLSIDVLSSSTGDDADIAKWVYV